MLIMSLKRSKEHIRLVQLCLDIFSHLLRVFRYEQEHAGAAAATDSADAAALLEHSLINQGECLFNICKAPVVYTFNFKTSNMGQKAAEGGSVP